MATGRIKSIDNEVRALQMELAAMKASAIKAASELSMISQSGKVNTGSDMIATLNPKGDYYGDAPLADLRVAGSSVTPITADGNKRRWLVRFITSGSWKYWVLITDIEGDLSWTTA